MWFKFPEGTDQVSVAGQVFHPEAKDEDGVQFFRAPDHFAPTILDLPGFTRTNTPPEGAPKDLEHEEPEVANAMSQLADQNEAFKASINDLRGVNQDFGQQVKALESERDGLKSDLDDAEKEVSQLKARIAHLEKDLKEDDKTKPGSHAETKPGPHKK